MTEEPVDIEYNENFKEIECSQCGYKGKPDKSGKVDKLHGYALRCPMCNKFWGWGGRKKLLRNESGNRVLSSIWTAKRLGIDFCQCCLRKNTHMGDTEQLEVHHVVQVSDGGQDIPANIWVVCTSCHKEIHHRRVYMNAHMSKFFRAYESLQDILSEGTYDNA